MLSALDAVVGIIIIRGCAANGRNCKGGNKYPQFGNTTSSYHRMLRTPWGGVCGNEPSIVESDLAQKGQATFPRSHSIGRGPGSSAPVLTEHEVGMPGWLHQRADKTGEVDQVTDPSRPRAQSYVRQPAPVPGT